MRGRRLRRYPRPGADESRRRMRGSDLGDLGVLERKKSIEQATILAALRPGAVERSFQGAVARQACRRMARNQLGHARQARPAAKAAKGGYSPQRK